MTFFTKKAEAPKAGKIPDYVSCSMVANKAVQNIEDAEKLRNEMQQLYEEKLVHNLQNPELPWRKFASFVDF